MNIYGMGQGQALGQGTFTFDKIAPNRYLLDRYANEDRILPGRYALVEYSHCIAEVKDWNEDYSLEYDPGSKLYDIIKVKDRVISFEEDAEDKIFICVYDEEDKYYFYYADIPDSKTSIYYPIETQEESINYWIPYNNNESLSIFEFNLQVDTAYANSRDNDDIILKNSAEGWDSTAWLKIIEKDSSGSNFKYINIADLNVIAPTISVTANQAYSFTAAQNDTLPSTTAVFLPPIVTQDASARATFDISFAKPMDINIVLDTAASEGNATATFEYTQVGKNYTFKLPEIGNVINATTTAINATTTAINATTAVLDLIKYPRDGSFWPQDGGNPPDVNSITGSTDLTGAGKIWEAIQAAKSVAGTGQANIINSIGTDGITVSIGSTAATSTLVNGKLNIEVEIYDNRIIKASDINDLWDPPQQNNNG